MNDRLKEWMEITVRMTSGEQAQTRKGLTDHKWRKVEAKSTNDAKKKQIGWNDEVNRR
jgi:hypothetical protein